MEYFDGCHFEAIASCDIEWSLGNGELVVKIPKETFDSNPGECTYNEAVICLQAWKLLLCVIYMCCVCAVSVLICVDYVCIQCTCVFHVYVYVVLYVNKEPNTD